MQDNLGECAQPLSKVEELARLRRKVRYAEQQSQSQLNELARLCLGAELLARLSWTMQRAYLDLLEYNKAEGSVAVRDFAESYGKIMNLADTVIEQVENMDKSPLLGFADTLSKTSMETLLSFIHKIRTNHSWVADCLSTLTAAELESWLPAIATGMRQNSTLHENSRTVDEVKDLQRSDLVYSLIFGIYAAPGLDTGEDELRLGLSVTVMCRMIQDNKASSKTEKFCFYILDSWADMYGWTAAKHFETLLLEILHYGTRILDRVDAKLMSSQGRGYYPTAQRRDQVEEEFFADSVRKILRLLDNDELGGLPAGALILGKAILAQVSEADRRHYETFIIIAWFFNRSLSRSITNPEQHGILVDHHISDVKRQRILLVLEQKLCGFCSQTTRTSSLASTRSTIEEDIEAHIFSIVSKFRGVSTNTRKLCLTAVTSENFLARTLDEAHAGHGRPSFHISPQQIMSLHDALYHRQRCESPESQLTRHSSMSSTISNRSISRHLRSSRIIFDIGSSHHEDSVERNVESEPMTCATEPASDRKVHDQAHQLRCAIKELHAVSCDAWEPVFVTPDGLSPTSNIVRAMDEVCEAETDVIRTAIYHFLEYFDTRSAAKRQDAPRSSYFSKIKLQDSHDGQHISTYPGATRPPIMLQFLAAGQMCFNRREYSVADTYYRAYSTLQRKLHTPEAIDDFSPLIHTYCMEHEHILENIEMCLEDNLDLKIHALDYKAKLAQKIDDQIAIFAKVRLRLWYQTDVVKSKQWQQAWEVVKCLHKMRPAEATTDNFSQSLPFEQTPYHTSLVRTASRERRFTRFGRDHRPSTPNQSASTRNVNLVDHTILDTLLGTSETIIPEKLGLDQARQTQTWMQEFDIHNFCTGEERIQRFCFEVDDLLRRLLGVITHPLDEIDMDNATNSKIWQKDLFQYENRVFNIPSRTQEYRLLERLPAADLGFGGLLRRGSAGDLLNLTRTAQRHRGNSVGSLDTPHNRKQLGRVSSSAILQDMNVDDTSESSFVHPSDPFRLNVDRPRFDTAKRMSSQDEQAIKDFLLQTQLGLTALLLSDFTDVLYWHGSETDQWFNDENTESILSRSDSLDTCSMNSSSSASIIQRSVPATILSEQATVQTVAGRPKHLRQKSLSISHLFNASTTYDLKSTLVPPAVDLSMMRTISTPDMERISSSNYFESANGSDSSVTPSTPVRSYCKNSLQPHFFPKLRAYKDIMHRFSITPAPYEKLRALYEFELLIVSTLKPVEAAPDVDLPKLAPTMPSTPLVTTLKGHAPTSPTIMKTRARKDSVDISKARVEELCIQPISDFSFQMPSPITVKTFADTPGTDAIVDEMQKVLRDPEIRPKTLFRDLQFIASFIPAHILNMTDEGKVFWDFSLAALAIRRETLDRLVDQALLTLPPQHEKQLSERQTNLGSTEAVKILAIAAKERHCKAMGAFGRLLLEQPAMCPLVLPPFSSPMPIYETRRAGVELTIEAVKPIVADIWLNRAVLEGGQNAQEIALKN